MARHGRQPATSTSSRRGNKAPPRSLSTADGQSAAEITTLNSLEHQTKQTKQMKNRIYVAFNYRCGVASNSRGERFGNYHVFASAAERDNFVASGGDFRTENDWRESIPSVDTEWRRFRRSINAYIINYGSTWERACHDHFVKTGE
jgi:hypothetical protein